MRDQPAMHVRVSGLILRLNDGSNLGCKWTLAGKREVVLKFFRLTYIRFTLRG
jgi:hypothetical protein